MGLAKLDEVKALKGLADIDSDCNLLEVIAQILKAEGLNFTERQIVCDGRLRAAFVLEDKTIIDVIDH